MKQLLLLLPLTFLVTPVQSQQINSYTICNQSQSHSSGGYDQYGNYVSGGVTCKGGDVNIQQTPSSQSSEVGCRPTESVLGALLGGGIAASMSRGDGYAWSVPLGAAIGGAIIGCN